MGKILTMAVMGLLLGALAVPASAWACQETVEETETLLAEIQKKAEQGKKTDPTGLRWLKESAEALADAKNDCEMARGWWRKRVVASRVLTIRAKIGSAQSKLGLVEDKPEKKAPDISTP